jgi:hypothetical protein
MRDAVIVEAVRTSHRQRQADRGARRRSPGRQHQPGRQTGARRGPDPRYPQLRRYATGQRCEETWALTEEGP